MLRALLLLLGFQVLGEAAARALAVPVPGPVIGMALILGLFLLRPAAAKAAAPAAQAILPRLSLLFVPAGLGVVGHLGALGEEALALGVALVVSTLAAVAAGAWVFVRVARWTGAESDR
jgi:putative effector of murein hydrolase LrgA (UPF0299 family)